MNKTLREDFEQYIRLNGSIQTFAEYQYITEKWLKQKRKFVEGCGHIPNYYGFINEFIDELLEELKEK